MTSHKHQLGKPALRSALRWGGLNALVGMLVAVAGCGDESASGGAIAEGTLGPEGGALVAPSGGEFSGLEVVAPAGALSAVVEVAVSAAQDDTPLPERAVGVGPQVYLQLTGAPKDVAALSFTLPTDTVRLANTGEDWKQVKVWKRGYAGWDLVEPQSTSEVGPTLQGASTGVYFAGVKLDE